MRESSWMEPPSGWGPVVAAAALGAGVATCLRPAASEPDGSSSDSSPPSPLRRSGGSAAAQQRWKKLASMSKERAAFRKAAASASPRWRELVATEMLDSKWGRLGEEHRALVLAAGGEEVELEQQEFREGDVLVVVDMQNDFIPGAKGGGRLGTSEGKQISPLICDLIAAAAASGARIVATRDYHPRSHFSFDANGGCLPVHCVQGCPGSHFFPPIAEALDRARKERTPPHPPRPSPTCCFTASDRSVTPVRQLTTPRWRRTDPGSVDVVFKGFVQQADSFGSVKYSAEDFQKKAIGMKGVTPMTPICGCSALDWTGSFVLGASNLEVSRMLILPRAKRLQAERGDLKHRVLCCAAGGYQCAAGRDGGVRADVAG